MLIPDNTEYRTFALKWKSTTSLHQLLGIKLNQRKLSRPKNTNTNEHTDTRAAAASISVKTQIHHLIISVSLLHTDCEFFKVPQSTTFHHRHIPPPHPQIRKVYPNGSFTTRNTIIHVISPVERFKSPGQWNQYSHATLYHSDQYGCPRSVPTSLGYPIQDNI